MITWSHFSLFPRSLWLPSPPDTDPKPAKPAVSDEENFVRTQLLFCKQRVVTGPSCGRVGTVSFGRGGARLPATAATAGSSNASSSSSSSMDGSSIRSSGGSGSGSRTAGDVKETSSWGLSRGAVVREGRGVAGAAGFQVEVLQEFGDVERANRAYVAASGAAKTLTIGVTRPCNALCLFWEMCGGLFL